MSIVPEFVLQTTLVRGIRTMRQDPRFVAQLFRNVDQKSLEQMKKFLRENPIDLAINYPRTGLKLPAIVILLKNETESQAFLGDELGTDVPDAFSFDGPVTAGAIPGVASTTSLSGLGPVLFGPAHASGATLNTINAPSSEPDAWDADQFLVGDQPNTVRIVDGTGKGQIRPIVANSGTTLMVSPNWKTVPDTTSIFVVMAPPVETMGEPQALYERNAWPVPQIARRGGLYGPQYQIQVIGPNPEMTIFLSVIVKSIFTLSRIKLEEQGIINMKMSATDFLPRAEYVPDYAYMRAVNLEFVYPFDTFEDLSPELAQQFNIALEAAVDDVVLSLTTLPAAPPPSIPT